MALTHCPQCRGSIVGLSNFCPECGYRLPKFCTECGQPLRSGGESLEPKVPTTEYKIHYIVEYGSVPTGEEALNELIKAGWQVTDEEEVERWINGREECVKFKYKLQRQVF